MIEPPSGYALLGLLVLPVLALWQHIRRRHRTVPVNISPHAPALAWTWRRSTLWLLPMLHWIGMAALVVAAARPFDWRAASLLDSEGIAIELVIDRSGSMRRDDFEEDGRRIARLQAVAEAASRFIIGDPELGSRHQDLIGLVGFAGDAEVVCPLTLDHEQVVAKLERMEAVADYRRDGTAIGDGMALAVAELQSLEASLHAMHGREALTRVIVLLTDGQQNAGQMSPLDAARLARHHGVRAYVIGLGESEPAARPSPSADRGSEPDAGVGSLRVVAELTGGAYFEVSETRSLRAIYTSINALERSQLTQRRLATRREWAVEWFRVGPWGLPPIALVALVALAAETLLRRTLYLQVL